MAKGQIYQIEYKDYKDVNTKIEIWQEDYTGNIEVVDAAESPLEIEMPDLNTIFAPVASQGATMKLLSSYDAQFRGLYSVLPTRNMVKIYKGSATDPFWMGYINTEVYSENYSRLDICEISLFCNDGFAALKRFDYLDTDGSKFSGKETKWTVLQRILTKMGLPYRDLYFACEHIHEDMTIASDETLFHNTKVDNENYYNEKGEPLSFRQVLEELLKPYPLQIRWHDGDLWIIDPSMLADANFNAKKFNNSGVYQSTPTVDANLDISANECEWDETDQRLDIISGFNMQNVRYSPYAHEMAALLKDITNQDNWTGTPVWTQDSGGGNLPYRLSGITAVAGWVIGAGGSFTGVRADMDSDPEIYFKRAYDPEPVSNLEIVRNELTSDRIITGIYGQSILFKCKVYIRTKLDEFDEEEEPAVVRRLTFQVAPEVDGKRPDYDRPNRIYNWNVNTENYQMSISGENIADQWLDVQWQIPWNFPPGTITLRILDPVKAYTDLFAEDLIPKIPGVINEVKFKDIELNVIDVNDALSGGRQGYDYGEASFDDIEDEGKINLDFLNEAPSITLLHSDGAYITDRGAIRLLDNFYTNAWKKTGDSSYYALTNILLRTIISQYLNSLIQLSGTLEADDMMTGSGCLSFFNTLKDTTYLGARKLMCVGGVYNDFKRTLNGRYLEIKQDDLTINVES